MTIEECYSALCGDYASVLARLHSERLVQKFLFKFPDDGSYTLLCGAIRRQDGQEAFRAAHTLKGICQNLGFTALQDSSSRLTEALRSGWTPEALPLACQVERDYLRTVEAIRAFQREAGQ